MTAQWHPELGLINAFVSAKSIPELGVAEACFPVKSPPELEQEQTCVSKPSADLEHVEAIAAAKSHHKLASVKVLVSAQSFPAREYAEVCFPISAPAELLKLAKGQELVHLQLIPDLGNAEANCAANSIPEQAQKVVRMGVEAFAPANSSPELAQVRAIVQAKELEHAVVSDPSPRQVLALVPAPSLPDLKHLGRLAPAQPFLELAYAFVLVQKVPELGLAVALVPVPELASAQAFVPSQILPKLEALGSGVEIGRATS